MFFGSKSDQTRVEAAPVEDLANLKATDARPGDTISVVGAGDDFADLDFTIERRLILEVGAQQWVEVSGAYRNRRVTLEASNSAENCEVLAWVDGRTITLDELGLLEEDLMEIDKRQNPADNFEFDGVVWKYRWSREIGLLAERTIAGPGCYVWRFRDEKKRSLTVRKFLNEPFTAYVSVPVDAGDVTVFRE